jgi:hypothetical protein
MDTDEDGGDSNENIHLAQSTSSTKPFRIKMYPSTFPGPYVIYFRKRENPINVLLISSEIYKKYKSVKEIKKISLDKLRVVFGSRVDANALLESKLFFNSYRVYAPCDSCEISGVIYDESLNCDVIRNHGSGIFKNKSISPVQILDCDRLSKLSFNGNDSKYVHSNCIKITFAGSVLPDYVMVGNVIFHVRLHYPKLMHCDRCLLFGHTSQFCSNKLKCSKCGDSHTSSDCKKNSDVCIYCKQKHNSFKECPVYIENQLKLNQKIKNKNLLSYADITKPLDNITASNTFAILPDDDVDNINENQNNFSYIPPIKRKRTPNKSSKTIHIVSEPQPSTSFNRNFPPLNDSNPPKVIPGFQKIDSNHSLNNNDESSNIFSGKKANESTNNSILSILEEIINFLNFNDFWKKIIKMLLPFLASLLEKLNSFGPLIVSLFSS